MKSCSPALFSGLTFIFTVTHTLAAPDKAGPVPPLAPDKAAEKAEAAAPGKGTDPTKGTVAPRHVTEEEFMRAAIDSAQANIALATLAGTRAQSPEVRAFAETVVKDNKTSLELLRATALRANLVIGDAANPAARKIVESLNRLEHHQFDSAFLDALARQHKNDLALHESGKKAGMSDFVLHYIQAHESTLKRHAATLTKMEPDHGGGAPEADAATPAAGAPAKDKSDPPASGR